MIEEALRDMRCMVVLWSSHSVESDWVKEEAEEARALGKLIPVLIEPVKPPVGFRSIQAADLTAWDGSRDSLGARQLIADLESLMAQSVPPEPTKGEEPHPNHPIRESGAVEIRAADNAEVDNQNRGPATVPGRGSQETQSARRFAVGWAAAAAILIIVAGLVFFLWDGNPDRTTSVTEVPAVTADRVSAPNLVRLDVAGDRPEVATNETANVTLKGYYTDGTQKILSEGAQWLSSETSVATIDDHGRLTARQPGETKITARYGDLVSSAWILTVRPEEPVLPATMPAETPAAKSPATVKPVSLTVSAVKREVRIQERLSLRVKATYSDGKEKGVSSGVEWRTSDPSVAVVDARGELVGLQPGKTLVVARWREIESALGIVVRQSPAKAPPIEKAPPKPISPVEAPPIQRSRPTVQPVDVGPYLNRAKNYRVQGNYAAALAELEKARGMNPASQEVLDEIEATRRACNAEKRLGREDLNC
jgi:hypothetical protein